MSCRQTLRLAILLLLLSPWPLSAWSKQSQVNIAWEAARLAPKDLYRQIVRHQSAAYLAVDVADIVAGSRRFFPSSNLAVVVSLRASSRSKARSIASGLG